MNHSLEVFPREDSGISADARDKLNNDLSLPEEHVGPCCKCGFEVEKNPSNEARALCIQEMFEQQTALTPEAVAVVCQGRHLTYRELNARANQLAVNLRQLNVGPEVIVGIYMERSWEMLVGIPGVLKAGGAYLPLDPSYPSNRLSLMLEDAQPPVILTQENLCQTLPAISAQTIFLDALPTSNEVENPTIALLAEKIATFNINEHLKKPVSTIQRLSRSRDAAQITNLNEIPESQVDNMVKQLYEGRKI